MLSGIKTFIYVIFRLIRDLLSDEAINEIPPRAYPMLMAGGEPATE